MVLWDENNPEATMRRIAELEADPQEYARVLAEPILRDGNHTLAQHFSLDSEVGGGLLRREIRGRLGLDPGPGPGAITEEEGAAYPQPQRWATHRAQVLAARSESERVSLRTGPPPVVYSARY